MCVRDLMNICIVCEHYAQLTLVDKVSHCTWSQAGVPQVLLFPVSLIELELRARS